ncbi:hypothetical protein GUJ93_ZPchr0006g44265 [Zizania palustris]|uniref:Uncharacterized protein n=1 Tax=Zizania palustris TaxID=103762 RepID=A0A8J5W3G6_ZIZPA|nr:hypothetical protein GUJ93_ZPchr0006g44265 [Zizania palustris]
MIASWAQGHKPHRPYYLPLAQTAEYVVATVVSPTMATATPTTTTPSLPGYQVSSGGGASAVAATASSRHVSGSIGAFLAVLAAVLVVAVLSCVVGRVCAARAEGPDERYDCTWMAGRRRCWRWRWAPRRPAEAKQPAAALPLPEP